MVLLMVINLYVSVIAASVRAQDKTTSVPFPINCAFANNHSPKDCYLPPTKLREGNVFTGVCHSVHREVRYLWSHGPSGEQGIWGRV